MIPNTEKLNFFPLRLEERKRLLLSLLPFNTVLAVLAIRQEKEIKGIWVREK